MNINATLFVQAINFCIAYLLFRFIFLKPAYRSIQQEQSDQKQLEGMVAEDTKIFELVRQERQDRWADCRQYCKNYVPDPLDKAEIFRGIVPFIPVAAPSLKELNVMAKRIAQTIAMRMEEK